MKRILLDTNAYSAILRNGNQDVLAAIDRADELLFSAIVLGELYAGFRAGNRYAENRQLLDEFLQDEMVRTVSISPDTAEIFGEIKHGLRQAGTPVPLNDIWIAAQCFEHGAWLVTFDQHFAQVSGLMIYR